MVSCQGRLHGMAPGQRGKGLQILGLTRRPGIGKSIPMKFLIEHLPEKLKCTSGTVLALHFCDRRYQTSSTATSIIREILFQLYQQGQRTSVISKRLTTFKTTNSSRSFINYEMFLCKLCTALVKGRFLTSSMRWMSASLGAGS